MPNYNDLDNSAKKPGDSVLFEFNLNKDHSKPAKKEDLLDPKVRASISLFKAAYVDFLQNLNLDHNKIQNKETLQGSLTAHCDNLCKILHTIDLEILKKSFGFNELQIKQLYEEIAGDLNKLIITIKSMAEKFDGLKTNLQEISHNDKNQAIQAMLSIIESFQQGTKEIHAIFNKNNHQDKSHPAI